MHLFQTAETQRAQRNKLEWEGNIDVSVETNSSEH
jgi:hypothetical protein